MSENIKFKAGVGLDVGTANIAVCRQTEDGNFLNKFHRNLLYPLEISEESTDLLEKSEYLYIKSDNKYYVIGDDGLKLSRAIGGDVIRPMQNGLLSPSLKNSSELLFFIIKAVVGTPLFDKEPLRFSVPANSCDVDNDNTFHKVVLERFLNQLSFSAKSINEALCICFDSVPILKSEDKDIPLSGITISCGAGQWNIAMSLKGLNLVEFSCTKSGDWLDEQVAKVTGVSKSKVIKIKESELDLNKDDPDRVLSALKIYYEQLVDRMLNLISNRFREKSNEMDGKIEIVVAGGTSMVPGFCDLLEKRIREIKLPFDIYRVRHAIQPFFSVSQGANIRAQADFEKTNKNK